METQGLNSDPIYPLPDCILGNDGIRLKSFPGHCRRECHRAVGEAVQKMLRSAGTLAEKPAQAIDFRWRERLSGKASTVAQARRPETASLTTSR